MRETVCVGTPIQESPTGPRHWPKTAYQQVRVCAGFDPLHNASYLQGLLDCFGTRHLHYTCEGFPPLVQNWSENGQNLAFIVDPPGWRVYLDMQDVRDACAAALEWCDLYAKVNLDLNSVSPQYAAKMFPIGPTFPFTYLNSAALAWHALHTFLMGHARITRPRTHFAHWRALGRDRAPYAAYAPGKSESNYAFFSSSLWKQDHQCNRDRVRFIEACRPLNWLQFEGGFAQPWRVKGYENFIVPKRPSHVEYLAKTKRSAVVFNSPSVFGGHGWKLAEFLSMGKAIIVIPLVRLLPAPLLHGEHIHYVDGSVEAIRQAVEQICRDTAYRTHLERGAREYYLAYLQPRRVIERILSAVEHCSKPRAFSSIAA